MLKQKAVVFAVSIAASFLISGCAGYMHSSTAASSAYTEMYTIKETDGYIGIYYGESESPDEILEVSVCDFPPEDQALLQKGITVYSRSELNALLEDYSG